MIVQFLRVRHVELVISVYFMVTTVSICRWKQAGVRGLWVRVALEHASLVPICAQVALTKITYTL